MWNRRKEYFFILRDKKEDLQDSDDPADYMTVLQTEVDKFFNMQEEQAKAKTDENVPSGQVCKI